MYISSNDPNTYRYVTLDNQLTVLLVSDEKSKKSAAALAVKVGHFDDPLSRPGLAHYLEHMLFLGTKPYPQMEEFQSFISRHGGVNNAWTGSEHTSFFFDIPNAHYEDGLHRFSAFFHSPLFNPDAVDKERHAVDSEYQMKLNDDTRRIYQVHKEIINQEHPFSHFSVGNAKTLHNEGNTLRDELISFYQLHYSADLMTLTLVSPHSLDQMESWAKQYFSIIENRHQANKCINTPFWTPDYQPIQVAIEPLKELRRLSLAFQFPTMDDHYQTKPLSFLAHMISYEGAGSVTHLLKKKHWISSLSAGTGLHGSNFCEFTINCMLTPLGLEHTDDIIRLIFEQIRLVTQYGIEGWRYQEKQSVMEAAFRFQEPIRALDLATHLVMNLQYYRPEDVIYGDYMMARFEPQVIQQMADSLVPQKCRVTIVAQQTEYDSAIKYDREAKWYFTPYKITPITEQQLELWSNSTPDPELALPKPNSFICHNLDPKPLTSSHTLPTLIQQVPGFRLWHLQEQNYRVPKGSIYIAIDSPRSVENPHKVVMLKLCVELFMEALSENTYQAELAGMSYNMYAHQGGITLTLYGFTEKLPLLLQMIFSQFHMQKFNPARFQEIKRQLARYWQNTQYDRPISQLLNAMTGLLQPNNPPNRVLLSSLESVQLKDLPLFIEQLLEELYVEMFVYGDWQKQQAHDMAEGLKDILRIKNQQYKESLRPLVLLGQKGCFRRELYCQLPDSAVLIYHQSQDSSSHSIALFTLANHLMSAAFFNDIRTKQQLGYMVGTTNMPLNLHPGIVLYVQSSNTGSEQLRHAIDEFLNAFYMVLLELSDEQWHSSKKGLLDQIMVPDPNLKAKGQRLWVAIGNKDSQFNHREQVVEQIEKLTRADMLRFVIEELRPRTANRLIMFTQGSKHQDQPAINIGQEIGSIEDFQLMPKDSALG